MITRAQIDAINRTAAGIPAKGSQWAAQRAVQTWGYVRWDEAAGELVVTATGQPYVDEAVVARLKAEASMARLAAVRLAFRELNDDERRLFAMWVEEKLSK